MQDRLRWNEFLRAMDAGPIIEMVADEDIQEQLAKPLQEPAPPRPAPVAEPIAEQLTLF
jgi:hypothetical protein